MLTPGTDGQNEAPAEHVSPDGQWKYVSFDRNCGATTGSNLQISVLPVSNALSSGTANAFIKSLTAVVGVGSSCYGRRNLLRSGVMQLLFWRAQSKPPVSVCLPDSRRGLKRGFQPSCLSRRCIASELTWACGGEIASLARAPTSSWFHKLSGTILPFGTKTI